MANGERIHTAKIGRVEASVWKKPTENGAAHSVSVNCVYKNGDEWKRSTVFRPQELPLLIEAVREAYRFLYTPKKKAEPKETTQTPQNDVEFYA